MSKKIIVGILALFSLAILISLIFIFRIDPYTLSVQQLLFFIFLIFVIIFSLIFFVQIPLMRKWMQRKETQGIILRRAFLISLFLSLVLALQIFGAFSILGVVLLGAVFLLLEFYFKSR
ncbi:MAG: hypothetical protein PHW50_01540 [Patescibacteria group bacterium]|nr:hypothetical protein [Patescibacteria group bacterium]